MTVIGMLCVWDKGRMQWISQQQAECCYLRRIMMCACNFKDTNATLVIHHTACHCNIAIQYAEVSQLDRRKKNVIRHNQGNQFFDLKALNFVFIVYKF